jgi:hypothetical protein
MKNNNDDSFFTEPNSPEQQGREVAVEAMSQLLIWVSSAPSLEDRGLRATVVLFCVRPDLIEGATLEQIGQSSGRTKQHIHNLVRSFRRATGFKP